MTVGNNDLLRSVSDRRLITGLEELCRRLPPTSIIATMPQLGSLRARSINRRIRALAATHDLGCADVGAQLTTWRGRQAGDRFHPNDIGYKVWTDAFAAATEEIDAARCRPDG